MEISPRYTLVACNELITIRRSVWNPNGIWTIRVICAPQDKIDRVVSDREIPRTEILYVHEFDNKNRAFEVCKVFDRKESVLVTTDDIFTCRTIFGLRHVIDQCKWPHKKRMTQFESLTRAMLCYMAMDEEDNL